MAGGGGQNMVRWGAARQRTGQPLDAADSSCVWRYMNGDPSNIYRQRLYSWDTNATAGEIILSFFDFNNGTKCVRLSSAHVRMGL